MYDISDRLLQQPMEIPGSTDAMLGNGYAAGVYILQINQGKANKVLRVVKTD